jgi:molybdopterin-dependent oxidoreductase alpha subunit
MPEIDLDFAGSLLLLALEPDSGRLLAVPPRILACGASGALLLDLAYAGRIDTDLTDLQVIDDQATGRPLLDEILAVLVAHADGLTVPLAVALTAVRAEEVIEVVWDDLRARNAVCRKRRVRRWNRSEPDRYVVVDLARRADLVRRVRAAVCEDGPPEPRDAALVGLVDTCRLVPFLFAPDEIEARKERLACVGGLEFIGRGILHAVRRMEKESVTEQVGAFLGLAAETPAATAGGVPAIVSAVGHVYRKVGVLRGAHLLSRVNQSDGFDCPACAWPDPADRSPFEFCENGAKYMASEATPRGVDPTFFQRWSIEDLARQSPHRLHGWGRLTHPVIRRAGEGHYAPISYGEALDHATRVLRELPTPRQAAFYVSGRAPNEAVFLFQLLARRFGSPHLPDSASLCHEASAVALRESLGFGKGSVTLEDIEQADAIFLFGHNPGSNHPRMLTSLQRAVRSGCRIVAVNPLPEAGLLGFVNPREIAAVSGTATPLASLHLPVRINGDQALLQGMMKLLLESEDRHPGAVLDRAFIEQRTSGFDDLAASLRRLSWEAILRASGLDRDQIASAVDVFRGARRVVATWCLGLTQHVNAVATIQDVVNLLLLGGHVGRSGTGVFPVRGHSSVQGGRSMGAGAIPKAFRTALAREFGFEPPDPPGWTAVETVEAMHDGRCAALVSLGGNLAGALPDTEYVAEAFRKCRLTVHVATHLNLGHALSGREAIILPCLGRTETDTASPESFVTVEDAVGLVHRSRGCLAPVAPGLWSETRIIAELAYRMLGEDTRLPWLRWASDPDPVRDAIARVVPGFEDFNRRVREGAGFALPNPLRRGEFPTPDGRARFVVNDVSSARPGPGELLLMTIRSHDQFNTAVLGLDDRYRGIRQDRRVVFLNPEDMASRGLAPETLVDLGCTEGGRRRVASGYRAIPYPIAVGCAAAYFPEANVLVPIGPRAIHAGTPAYKSVVVKLRRAGGALWMD